MAGAMLVLPAACGNTDEATFESKTTLADATTTTGASATTAAPSTTVEGASTVGDAGSGDTAMFPAGGELLIDFTYTASGTNNPRRPFVAVWIEDTEGNFIDTVSLWYNPPKGDRWLDDLTQWYGASGGSDTTMSAATRTTGEYTVTWDGTDAAGNPVATGDYVILIESAVEHGPTSFTSGTVTVSDGATTASIPDDGELSAIAATLTV